jgi:hypothetical protein
MLSVRVLARPGQSFRYTYPFGMSDEYISDDDDPDQEPVRLRVPWVWQEVLSAAALGSLGLIVLGGLAAGIATSTQSGFPVSPLNIGWTAVQSGTSWANPYFAIFLLAILGTTWWMRREWLDGREDDEEEEVSRHLDRSRGLQVGAQVGLLIVALAAILGFVAILEENLNAGGTQSALDTSTEIGFGVDAAAVLLLVVVGLWVSRRLDRPQQGGS